MFCQMLSNTNFYSIKKVLKQPCSIFIIISIIISIIRSSDTFNKKLKLSESEVETAFRNHFITLSFSFLPFQLW